MLDATPPESIGGNAFGIQANETFRAPTARNRSTTRRQAATKSAAVRFAFASGLCAYHQLPLNSPPKSRISTGRAYALSARAYSRTSPSSLPEAMSLVV